VLHAPNAGGAAQQAGSCTSKSFTNDKLGFVTDHSHHSPTTALLCSSLDLGTAQRNMMKVSSLLILAVALGTSIATVKGLPSLSPSPSPAPVGSCVGYCGFEAGSGGCWCDELCPAYGDCCVDACTECGADYFCPVGPSDSWNNTLAKDEDPCTPPLYIQPVPEVSYSPGSILLDFGTAAFEGGTANIIMPMSRPNLPVSNTDKLAFAAVVFGNAQCTGDVIAYTRGAHFADAYSSPPTEQVFDLTIVGDSASSTQPELAFVANLTQFANPFFNQTDLCSDSAGAGASGGFNGEYNNETNPTDQYCGLLTYCVEFQSIYCGIKVDFVDVVVEIELDLTLDCDDCSDATLVRDAPENDGADDQLGDGIKCYVCDDPVDPEYTQGDVIEACFDPVRLFVLLDRLLSSLVVRYLHLTSPSSSFALDSLLKMMVSVFSKFSTSISSLRTQTVSRLPLMFSLRMKTSKSS